MLNRFQVGLATVIMAAAVSLGSPAQAQMRFSRISVSQSQGESGALPQLALSPQWGLAISFIKTGERIQQVRVGDPSRILTDFDSPLDGQQNGGANIIYLRQLAQPLDLGLRLPSAARASNQVPLSVVTQGAQGLNFYQFQLSLGTATEQSTVVIVPDSQMPVALPAQIALPRGPIRPGELPLPPLRLKPIYTAPAEGV